MRRSPVKPDLNRRHLLGLAATAAAGLFLNETGRAQPATAPIASHALDPGWPALSPAEYPEKCQVAGIAIDPDGAILMLNRGENHWMPVKSGKGYKPDRVQKPVVIAIDPKTGSIVRSWGGGMCVMPHQIRVDRDGRVWVVDCVQNRVFQCDPSGKIRMEIGGDAIGFKMPTDVDFLSDGSFVVTDGYVNTRVVKFDRSGKMLTGWGTKGSGPLQFRTPHSIAVDEADRLYVADRENHRIQVLSSDGKLLSIWTNVDRPLSVRYAARSLWVLSNHEADKGIVRRLNREGKLIESFPTKPTGSKDDFEWPHGLAVSKTGDEVYVGFTLTGRRIQRYRRIREG